tara:strand:- start:1001 stop:1708 length:708 start_codon:yes stop_codon:yes gene_type:complete
MILEKKVTPKDINYIVAFYNGERRHFEGSRWKIFIKAHINYLKKHQPTIGLVSFVINESFTKHDIDLIEYIEKQNLKFKYEVIIRENQGFSYGGFNQVMLKNHKDYRFSFVVEDDYVATAEFKWEMFLDKFTYYNTGKGNTAYVCCLHQHNHAAICNGLISNERIGVEIELLGKSIGDKYTKGGFDNQIGFMAGFSRRKYQIDDITDVAYTIFMDGKKSFINYGDTTKPLIMIPI